MFHAKHVGMLMVYGRCKFHMPYFSSSLVSNRQLNIDFVLYFYLRSTKILPSQKLHVFWRRIATWHMKAPYLVVLVWCLSHSSCVSHVGISVWRRMNIIKVEWPSYAWCAYQISLDFVSWFRRYVGGEEQSCAWWFF
jgi:hypothetical protein